MRVQRPSVQRTPIRRPTIMQRRDFVLAAAAAAFSASASAQHQHMHGAMAAPAPRKFDALIPAFQTCMQAGQACVVHCNTLLAQGDTSMAECQRNVLDTLAVCQAVATLAGYGSAATGTFAKQSVPVMQACVAACKPHIEHHAECKACHDACVAAIAAVAQLG